MSFFFFPFPVLVRGEEREREPLRRRREQGIRLGV
jgi:hypothetical protein